MENLPNNDQAEQSMDDLIAALNSEYYNPQVVHQSIVKKRVADRNIYNGTPQKINESKIL